MSETEIRESADADLTAIETLYPAAFPEEDLLPVVRRLLAGRSDVLSLVAVDGEDLIGHVAFSDCAVSGTDARVSLLAPLAVSPERQKRGIGTALVDKGFRRLRQAGVSDVYVLGDPAYYGRFGFRAETGVAPPYPLPDEWRAAWQSLRLSPEQPLLQGALLAPDPWRDPALWGA